MIDVNRKKIRIWSMLGMRRVVGVVLNELAKNDSELLFTTADLGRYFGIQELQLHSPEQVIDLGIAEQNLVGASAALQNEGYHVWAGTYATFITARALDQVRVNLGLMELGVKLIGAAGGLSDGNFSATHMALEDIADMRAIPNIAVLCPADGLELVKTMEALASYPEPAYLRLTGRANMPIIYPQDFEFVIGKANCIRDGTDVAIISAGTILGNVCAAAKQLQAEGISCKVIDMHTIKPLDGGILRQIQGFKLVVTVEEHMKAGGLGSAVAEYYAEMPIKPCLKIIALDGHYPNAAEYEDLLETCGLSASGIARGITTKWHELLCPHNCNSKK